MYSLWNDYQNKLRSITSLVTKIIFFVVRTFRIYSISNFQVYHRALLTVVIIFTLNPQHLFILKLEACAFWSTFTGFPHSPLAASGKHKSDVFFYEFGCFWLDVQGIYPQVSLLC